MFGGRYQKTLTGATTMFAASCQTIEESQSSLTSSVTRSTVCCNFPIANDRREDFEEETSVFCLKCGTALAEGAYFCPKCGADNSPGAITPTGSTPGAPDTPVQPQQTSGMAIGSLVCGLFPFLILPSIAAVILGHIALSQIKRSAGRLKGSGMAIAGLVLGYGSVAFIPIILIIAAIAIPNLLRARM